MSRNEFVIPAPLRGARFVRRQPGTRRAPARVTASAFAAAGLAVPDEPGKRNIYQLTQRRGESWSPALDAHVRRFGAELLGGDALLCIDLDRHVAPDGSIRLDGLAWLAEAAVAAGMSLDLARFVAVRTPGDPERGHARGWHLWCRSDADYPVRLGALGACPAVEFKSRATCPGSPGYTIEHVPTVLLVVPRWLAELAGHPRGLVPVPRPGPVTCSPDRAWRRMRGMLDVLAAAQPPGRNGLLYSAARLAGELGLDPGDTETALLDAAAINGLLREDGPGQCRATVRSGMAAGTRTVTR